MIWFGNLNRIAPGAAPDAYGPTPEDERMLRALEWVAERAPQLSGGALVDALTASGWVDRRTASRLLPAYRHFDPDRHFADHLRRLSFRGRHAQDDFLGAIRFVFDEIAGRAEISPEPNTIRFSVGEREVAVLAYPEVGFSISGATREAVLGLVEEMPDAIVIVARNFDRHAAGQLSGILHGTEVPGALLTVNLLLGIRGAALRYRPDPDRVVDLLSAGRPVQSRDVARLIETAIPA